jgi:hypothetical protein
MATTSLGLEQFKGLVEQVAVIGAGVATAEKDLGSREVEVLRALVERIKPVMRLIDKPVVRRYAWDGKQAHDAIKEYLPERGIVFADYIRETHVVGCDYRGQYDRFKLVLLRSGKLLRMDAKGDWSKYADEPTACEFQVHEITVEGVLEYADLQTVVKGCIACLKEAIRNAEAKKETLAPRLAALTKIEACLGGLTK